MSNPLGESSLKAAQAQPKDDSVSQLKTVTQNLKSITAPIAQQAILRNTGIIAGNELTEAQRNASKARTSRISLSSAIGAASVKDEAAPMKTIKISRPKIIQRAAPGAAVAAKPASQSVPATEAAVDGADAKPSPTITQKKTLKIARPVGLAGASRTKLAVKKPASPAPVAKEENVGDLPPVDNIEDIPPVDDVAAKSASLPADAVPAVSKTVAVIGLIAQLAACAVVGVLAYYLYQDCLLPLYCGGCTP